MNNNIVTDLALMYTMLDKRKRYCDIFLPFILKNFIDSYMTINSLKDEIDKSVIKLPIGVIENVIATNKTFFSVIGKGHTRRIALTEQGKVNRNITLENEYQYEKSVNLLYEDFYQFLSNGFALEDLSDLTIEKVKELFKTYMLENIGKDIFTTDNSANSPIILKYLLGLDRDSEHMKTISTMINGTVLYNHAVSNEYKNVDKAFNQLLYVYLDTNFIISLLGLHVDTFVKPAQELYEMMMSIKNINMRVLDITIGEIKSLILKYEPTTSINDYEAHTLFHQLKVNNWTTEEKYDFIGNLEYNLKEMRIIKEATNNLNEHDKFEKVFNLIDNAKNSTDDICSTLCKSSTTIEHDTTALIHVYGKVNARSDSIEGNRAIFLTSDFSLTRLDNELSRILRVKHIIISDREFSRIIFLSQPYISPNTPIDSLIKTFTSSILADKELWLTFQNKLKILLNKGTISLEVYALVQADLIAYSPYLNENKDELNNEIVVKEIIETVQKRKDLELTSSQEKNIRLEIQINNEKQNSSRIDDELVRERNEKAEIQNKNSNLESINKDKDSKDYFKGYLLKKGFKSLCILMLIILICFCLCFILYKFVVLNGYLSILLPILGAIFIAVVLGLCKDIFMFTCAIFESDTFIFELKKHLRK